MKKVFVNGDFNILHPGHLRLLKFAKESGDYLIVGVNGDNLSSKSQTEDIRLESINATSYVDNAFIMNTSTLEWIQKNKPDIVVKGKEHQHKENKELEIINHYGGKLLFSSGEIGFSSIDLLKRELNIVNYNVEHDVNYLKRHKIDFTTLHSMVEKLKELEILVIGDTIVDEYIICEPLGMSQRYCLTSP